MKFLQAKGHEAVGQSGTLASTHWHICLRIDISAGACILNWPKIAAKNNCLAKNNLPGQVVATWVLTFAGKWASMPFTNETCRVLAPR